MKDVLEVYKTVLALAFLGIALILLTSCAAAPPYNAVLDHELVSIKVSAQDFVPHCPVPREVIHEYLYLPARRAAELGRGPVSDAASRIADMAERFEAGAKGAPTAYCEAKLADLSDAVDRLRRTYRMLEEK